VSLYRKETKTTGIEPYIIEVMCLRLKEKERLRATSNMLLSDNLRHFFLFLKLTQSGK